MNVTHDTNNRTTTIHAAGRLDFEAAGAFQKDLEQAVADAALCAVVDLNARSNSLYQLQLVRVWVCRLSPVAGIVAVAEAQT